MNMCSWGLRRASDSELAAGVVEHSVASESLLLKICKAYDVFVDNWVSIPFTVGAPFRLNNEKPGTETGDRAMTYKLAVAAVGLCRHVVRIGSGFSRERSNGKELWILVVVRNLFARCGNSSCLVSTAAVGQQFCRSRKGRVLRQEEVDNRDDAPSARGCPAFSLLPTCWSSISPTMVKNSAFVFIKPQRHHKFCCSGGRRLFHLENTCD